jgi:hypothetical protein
VVIAEPDGAGPVSRAADILARAAAQQRSQQAPPDSRIAGELGRIADAMLMSGGGRHRGDAAWVVAAARLIVAIAELREAQQDLHAAGAARVAAERMMPLLVQAQQARGRAPRRQWWHRSAGAGYRRSAIPHDLPHTASRTRFRARRPVTSGGERSR